MAGVAKPISLPREQACRCFVSNGETSLERGIDTDTRSLPFFLCFFNP